LTSQVATLLAHHIGQVALTDPMSGFFAMRRQLFVMMDDGTLCPQGYKILLYLYSRAVRQFGSDRLRLQEVGYQFRKRESGRCKHAPVKRIFMAVASITQSTARRPYFIRRACRDVRLAQESSHRYAADYRAGPADVAVIRAASPLHGRRRVARLSRINFKRPA